jgi:hypothetical protein
MRAKRIIAAVTIEQCPHPALTGHHIGLLRRGRYAMICALSAWLLMISVPARADGVPYEELLDQAVAAFEANDFSRAHALFEQAYAQRPNARVSRGLGIAALRLEHYTEAQRWLTSALEDKTQALTSAQRDEVTKLLAWMQTSLGTLRLRWRGTPPPDNQLVLDDARVSDLTLWLTPGAHHLRVSAPGFQTRQEHIELMAGRELTRELSLTPSLRAPELVTVHREDMSASKDAPAAKSGALDLRVAPHTAEPQDSPSVLSRWWFWTAVGVVVAGGVTAAVLMTAKPSPRPYEAGGEGGVLHARGAFP